MPCTLILRIALTDRETVLDAAKALGWQIISDAAGQIVFQNGSYWAKGQFACTRNDTALTMQRAYSETAVVKRAKAKGFKIAGRKVNQDTGEVQLVLQRN